MSSIVINCFIFGKRKIENISIDNKDLSKDKILLWKAAVALLIQNAINL